MSIRFTDWEHAPDHCVRAELQPLHEIGVGQIGNIVNVTIDSESFFVMQVSEFPDQDAAEPNAGGAMLLLTRMMTDPEVIAAAQQHLHRLAKSSATAPSPKELQ